MSDDKKNPEGDYEIGFAKPPKHTRFKLGQSGNPRGRPKKNKDLNRLIQVELDATISVQEAGREKRITKREAIIKQLINRAIKGDPKATQFVLGHLEKNREVERFTPTDTDDAALLAAFLGTDSKEDDHGDS